MVVPAALKPIKSTGETYLDTPLMISEISLRNRGSEKSAINPIFEQ